MLLSPQVLWKYFSKKELQLLQEEERSAYSAIPMTDHITLSLIIMFVLFFVFERVMSAFIVLIEAFWKALHG